MSNDNQPYSGDPATSQGLYGGAQYLAPDRVDHYHETEATPPMPASRRVMLIAVVVALTLLGLLNVVRAIVNVAALGALAVHPDPTSNAAPAAMGLIGSLVLAALFFAYPIVVLVREVRRRRA
ncbi:MAG: hypothetical protein JWP75_1679 [Frondihabitans sp.]|nr:hypothetical protein [Frondihabitans sp.]